ncbi:MAG: regulatory protein RecX [Proteobacteria bacterium]|nr:regulatory protein RecX [Pseudomonadota bacterium]MDA1064494.1 regulatory protein RecX [Pseudomonadota bacterium]
MKDDKFSDPIAARKKAMDYLARREHGREELINKLRRAGFEHDTVNEAVARLVADRLQCDARFVEAFIAARINQGKGPLRICADLRERGIADAAIFEGLEAAAHDWHAAALEVRRKKFGARRPADFKDKARQMRFLQSRGFDTDQIQAAVSAPTE